MKVCQNDAQHQSSDPDICSICGGDMIDAANAAPVAAAPASVAAPAGGDDLKCGKCGFPKNHKMQMVCENCGLVFRGPKAGQVITPGTDEEDAAEQDAGAVQSSAVVPPTVPPTPTPAPAVVPLSTATGAQELPADSPKLRVRIELTEEDRKRTASTIKPSSHHEGIYLLDRTLVTIGRSTAQRTVDISLGEDDGVSRAHGDFLFESGQWYFRDTNSSNGTVLVTTGSGGNEERQHLTPNALTPIKAGDKLAVGFWTYAVVESR